MDKKYTNALEALREAYQLVSHIQKTGKNTFSNYTYASESDVLSAVRPALKEVGLTVRPLIIKDKWREKDGKNWHFGATYVFRFDHAETQTFFEAEAEGWGSDTLDKAANKAATVALKYALRQPLLLETGDDEEDIKPFKTKKEMVEHFKEYEPYLNEEIAAARTQEELLSVHAQELPQLNRFKAKCQLTHELLVHKFTERKEDLAKNKLTGAV